MVEDFTTTSSVYETNLHKAVREGNFELVKLLVEKQDADVNELNGAGQTALHEACRVGNEEIAVYLLNDENIEGLVIDQSGRQPITYAAASGLEEVVLKLLVFDGANVNGSHGDGENECGSPLWHAADQGREAVVKFLLRQEGIRINAFDVHHRTPLFQATRNGYVNVAKMLITAGADVSLAGLPDLENPLHIASVNGSESQLTIARMLLEEGGADPNSKTRLGYTALIVACIKGFHDIVKLLLESGADPNIALPDGLTALHLVCVKDFAELATMLVSYGADITLKDNDGMTPMRYAQTKGNTECMAAVEKRSRF